MDDPAHQSLGWCLWQAPVTPSHPCQGYDKAPASGLNGILINMVESLNRKSDNGVNGTGMSCVGPSPGRCSPAQQWGSSRHHATVRMKWNKEVNKVAMERFYRSKPFDEESKPIRGYRQRMFRESRDRGMFESTEQCVSDQARAIRKNGWLSELELEAIKRPIKDKQWYNV